jgi:hypothetical protein
MPYETRREMRITPLRESSEHIPVEAYEPRCNCDYRRLLSSNKKVLAHRTGVGRLS